MSDIKKKSDSDLVSFVKEKREEIRKARFAAAGAQQTDLKSLRDAKKDVARALTELTERMNTEVKTPQA